MPVQQHKQLGGMGSTIRDLNRRIGLLEARVRQASTVCVTAANVTNTTATSWTVFPEGGTFPKPNSQITAQVGSSGTVLIAYGANIVTPIASDGFVGVNINSVFANDMISGGTSTALSFSAWNALLVNPIWLYPGDNTFQLVYVTTTPGTGVSFINPILIVQPV
jgi:hypothetical protein